MVETIDFKDIPFVALTNYINGVLWTGDKKLIVGLQEKGFMQTITTAQLFVLLEDAEK